MPRNGSGTYTRTDGTYTGATVFQQEEANGVDILSNNLDVEAQDMATALTASIANDGQTPILANLPMSTFAHTGVGAATARTMYQRAAEAQDGTPNWAGTFGGTANALTCTLAPVVTAYTAGLVIRGIVLANNTAAATVNSNAVGTIAIRKKLAGGIVALTGGELIAGETVEFVSDGTYLVLQGKQEWQASASIASATPDLSASTGEYVQITGTTTITAFGTLPAGTTRTLRFAGAVLLTHNGTSLILPSAANITTAAGDVFAFTSEGAGNWRCTGYTLASGAAIVAGASAATQNQVDAGTNTTAFLAPAFAVQASWLAPRNYAFNPEGAVFQMVTPTTDNAYAWDMYRLLLGAANAATVSTITSSLPTPAKNAMRLTVGSGNNNKFGVFQILEGINVYALRGKTVCLQAQLAATAALTDIRMAIVNWTGTEDAVSADPISAWGAQATVPTYTGSWSNANTPANLSVTTSFAQYSVTATVSSTATNLAVFIWNEDTTSTQTTDKLDITMVQLTVAGAPTPYSPRDYGVELLMCQRYFRRVGGTTNEVLGVGTATSTTALNVCRDLVPVMRTTPTLTISTESDWATQGATGITQNLTTLTDAGTITPSSARFVCAVAAGLTGGQGCFVIANNTSARVFLNAGL